jgi:hypothetical protein
MLAMDTVAIYYIFGLTTNAIIALVRFVVTAVIIVLTLRIPYKRKYVWMFLIVEIAMLWFSGWLVYIQNAPTAAAYFERQTTLYTAANWAYTRVQVLLIFQFVVYFVSRKVSLWEKIVLVGGYAYAIATVWVPLVIDPSFLATPDPIHTVTVFGVGGGGGTAAPYLRPDGIDIYSTLMAIPIFFLLFRYYRSEKSPVMRGQTKYLIVGLILFLAGFYVFYLTQNIPTSVPSLLNLFNAGGDFVLLLGLRKKGFYSVTPTAETATAEGPAKYPLEEGRSYLAHDPKAAFEGFSELVRSGHEGLLITRIVPAEVRKDYGIQTTPIRWLAEVKAQDAIPPGDLLGLSLTIKDFLEKAKKPVVMLQGVEYLTTYNGFTPILRLINGLRESSAATSGILILPVLPDTLDKHEEALLASETTPMPMPTAS